MHGHSSMWTTLRWHCAEREQRLRQVAIVVALWKIFGFKLAFRKAQMGRYIKWIGAEFAIHSDRVEVTIDESKLQEIKHTNEKFLALAVISVKGCDLSQVPATISPRLCIPGDQS